MKVEQVSPGDRVEIIGGPFAGGRATVQAVEGGQLRVEMKVLGQPAPFSVSADQVRLIQSAEAALHS